MIKQVILVIAAGIVITLNSCGDGITGPGPDQPGSRNYVWNVDTVVSPANYPFKFLFRLWGSSPTDVWAVANGGDVPSSIFHFDGTKWVSSGERYEGKYLIPGYQPYSIYGFGSNDVYIGCEQGKIYHYDGTGMKEVATLTKDGHNDIVFDNMWGDTPNDLYAFGAYSDESGLANGSVIAYLFYGKWYVLNTDGLKGIVEHLYKNKSNNKIYTQVIKISNTDSTFIYEYDQDSEKYTELYKTIWDNHWATVSLINNEVYFVLRNEIAGRIGNRFQTILKLDGTNFHAGNIWGRNSKDIFLEMTDGLAHYNGSDIEYLFHYNQSNTGIFAAAIFDKEAFFLVHEFTTGLSLIYHGKLKE